MVLGEQIGLKASRRVAALRKVKSEGQDAVLDSFVASIRSAVRQNGGKGNHARAWNGDGRR